MTKNKQIATLESFMEFHKDFFGSLIVLTEKKNHDYDGTQDVFFNFEMVEKLGITSVEKGIMVRITDKISRINNFLEAGVLKVEDEKIIDTLKDLSNYAALLANYIHHKKLKDGKG